MNELVVEAYNTCILNVNKQIHTEGIVRLLDCRTGSLHLGPCIRALCAPHWNSFLPSSPGTLRTYRRERPLLTREGN
jgi:hypothetical protein